MPAQNGPPDPNQREGENAGWVATTLPDTNPQLVVTAYPPPSGVVIQIPSEKTSVTASPIDPSNWNRTPLREFEFRFVTSDNTRNLTYYLKGQETAVNSAWIPNADLGTSISSVPPSSAATATTAPLTQTSQVRPSVSAPGSQNSSSNSTMVKGDDGIAPGAVAGVAIGCLVAGALLSGLILWFCLGRSKKSKRGGDHESSSLALMPTAGKGPATKVLSVGSGSPVSRDLDSGLPQPLEDEAISSGVSGISVSIKNHVQSFYHTNRVSSALLDQDDLRGLGSGLPISPARLSNLLATPDTREIALRFCIAWVVVSRMQLSSPAGTTFLPPEVVDCSRSMALDDHTPQSQLLLAKWRGITGQLMQTTYVKNSFLKSDLRLQSIEKALDTLDGILLPFADTRMDNAQRIQNLREILKRAATFAFTLFSQPSTWEFDWQQQHASSSGHFCVFPSLVQVTGETGEPVRPPRVLSEAITRTLD